MGKNNLFGEFKFSPDNKWLAARQIPKRTSPTSPTSVVLWSLDVHQPLAKPSFLNLQEHAILEFSFAANSRFLFTNAADRSIVKWDISTRKPVFYPGPRPIAPVKYGARLSPFQSEFPDHCQRVFRKRYLRPAEDID